MGDIKAIFEALLTGGPLGLAMVFCLMWWLERKDRKEAEAQVYELAVSSVETSTKTEVALNTLIKLGARKGDT